MTSINDNALIIIICLLIFLILSLLTNGAFFSFFLYKNIRAKPKDEPKEKKESVQKRESPYVEMQELPDEDITPYYIKKGPTAAPAPPVPKPKELVHIVKDSAYTNLSDLNN